jgi:hypothetical protein
MEQDVKLKTEDIMKFCERLKGLEDKIDAQSKQLDEVKQLRSDFAKYRSDRGDETARMGAALEKQLETLRDGICCKIGEVPGGKSVMQIISVNREEQDKLNTAQDRRIDKVYWTVGVVLVVIEFMANYNKLATIFVK